MTYIAIRKTEPPEEIPAAALSKNYVGALPQPPLRTVTVLRTPLANALNRAFAEKEFPRDVSLGWELEGKALEKRVCRYVEPPEFFRRLLF